MSRFIYTFKVTYFLLVIFNDKLMIPAKDANLLSLMLALTELSTFYIPSFCFYRFTWIILFIYYGSILRKCEAVAFTVDQINIYLRDCRVFLLFNLFLLWRYQEGRNNTQQKYFIFFFKGKQIFLHCSNNKCR